MGSPNEDRFDAITVKLQQVYDEWSAEACGQQTVREKIVSDFEEFVRSIKGCKSTEYLNSASVYLYYHHRCCSGTVWINIHWVCTQG